jgi:hypothetical protein
MDRLKNPAPTFSFKPKKGDEVDEMLARMLAELGCKVPIKRLGDGYYLFGTRKIYAKIMNGRLVIRVGGGYMDLIEFVHTYSEVEMHKIENLIGKGIDPYEQFENKVAEARSPGSK